MTTEEATAAVSVSPQWLALRLGEHFPELAPEAVRWDGETAARLSALWHARYGNQEDATATVAGAWVVAVAWAVGCALDGAFWTLWLPKVVAEAQQHDGAVTGEAAAALALHLAGDGVWPLDARVECVMALMALRSLTVRLLPDAGETAALAPGDPAPLPDWGIAIAPTVQLVRRGKREGEGATRYWLDFSALGRQIDRLVKRWLQAPHQTQPQQLIWLLLALMERLGLGGRRARRQPCQCDAKVVVGWEAIAALASGAPVAWQGAEIVELSDWVLGARLRFATPVSVRDGEIVAVRFTREHLSDPAATHWWLGVVRWQRSAATLSIVGLQMLAPIESATTILSLAPEEKRGTRLGGIVLKRWLPYFPQPALALRRLERLSGGWWLVRESDPFRVRVERFQPGRIRLVTPHVTVAEIWPKEA
ncbi:hypothetical protein [Hydrogenophilus thiooxidans]|uniref:hypothetical protein n=1 Tax=Hydrogenophilus thiooxidans TaxID=2820326 RepID=UPI001C23EBE6|nr:hypothetical protein [Hydrogenophilus thiooxidans]